MPNYQYKCLKCGHEFQKLLPVGHTDGVKCLDCGHDDTQKQLSAPGVQFKGGGFYKTDSAAPAAKPATPAADASAPSASPEPGNTTSAPESTPKND